MAKSRKKSLSQHVVNTATIGMPKPAKKFLGGRIVSLLIVALIPVLIGTGMVTVRWENGRPKLSINRERTAEVRQEAAERVEDFKESHGDNRRAAFPHLGARAEKLQDALPNGQRDDQIEQRVAEQFGKAKDKLVGDGNNAWNAKLTKGRKTSADKQAIRPFRDINQKAKGLFQR